ncbi:hypothetical protein CRYUN_Cryun28dG0024100 [Craigia yunnanensis]
MRWPAARGGGLGVAAMTYVAVDYLRNVSPTWHERFQPLLWSFLALVAITRVPLYRHWNPEFRAALPFLGSITFMLSALLFEALSVRSVTAVLGLDWHSDMPPLPDTGQWLLLALNEKLPEAVVEIMRAHIIGLHHFLMLFIMLAFSVLFDSVKAPGLGLGARYMFTMAIGRLLRAITFASTILPSARPWYANAIHQVIQQDIAYADTGKYHGDCRPDWGSMSFLIDFLRPTPSEGSSGTVCLKRAHASCCTDCYGMDGIVLRHSETMEAYGGFSSVLIWLLVMHSAQHEIRERHHYTVDCIAAIYVGILLWKMTGFIWSAKHGSRDSRLPKRGKIQGRLLQAAKDSDMDEVRELLKDVELGSQESQKKGPSKVMWLFACGTIFFSLTIVVLAFTWTSDGRHSWHNVVPCFEVRHNSYST